MRIHNLFSDEHGESHFRDIEMEWETEGPDGTTSKRFPATGIIFRFTPGTWRFDWHTATRRQYVINLDGPNQITASDGETRIIGTGEVILIEDLHGRALLAGRERAVPALHSDPGRLRLGNAAMWEARLRVCLKRGYGLRAATWAKFRRPSLSDEAWSELDRPNLPTPP